MLWYLPSLLSVSLEMRILIVPFSSVSPSTFLVQQEKVMQLALVDKNWLARSTCAFDPMFRRMVKGLVYSNPLNQLPLTLLDLVQGSLTSLSPEMK